MRGAPVPSTASNVATAQRRRLASSAAGNAGLISRVRDSMPWLSPVSPLPPPLTLPPDRYFWRKSRSSSARFGHLIADVRTAPPTRVTATLYPTRFATNASGRAWLSGGTPLVDEA